ncbi:MAG: cytochrome oxidase subunit III, partial [Actinomycetota bacterium]|nr:cytochrome oxidase subunit III [Actinomycetota bacterium]
MDVTAGDHTTPPQASGHEEVATSTGLPNVKVAMWIFLASECLLFGALISTYVLYRGRSLVGPYPADVFDIPYTSVSSFVLLASSLTMVLALAAIQRGDYGKLRVWLLATAMLGMTFIGGQVYE